MTSTSDIRLVLHDPVTYEVIPVEPSTIVEASPLHHATYGDYTKLTVKADGETKVIFVSETLAIIKQTLQLGLPTNTQSKVAKQKPRPKRGQP